MWKHFCFAKPFPTYFLIFPKAALEVLRVGITGPVLWKRGTRPAYGHMRVTRTGLPALPDRPHHHHMGSVKEASGLNFRGFKIDTGWIRYGC